MNNLILSVLVEESKKKKKGVKWQEVAQNTYMVSVYGVEMYLMYSDLKFVSGSEWRTGT